MTNDSTVTIILYLLNPYHTKDNGSLSLNSLITDRSLYGEDKANLSNNYLFTLSIYSLVFFSGICG